MIRILILISLEIHFLCFMKPIFAPKFIQIQSDDIAFHFLISTKTLKDTEHTILVKVL